ncbi:hypothetical protein [Caballeronia sp. LZ035]|uniref:hypothetical protein n=1 Tax=Caballeronia sp. LZ035 TaxID=3038568 RepID=UPI00285D1694|nr:hypothetical protein [Caballeronia sp. LZ035]MDR5760956.1 hypothetical protein [Caballeronia sp. LZ035]
MNIRHAGIVSAMALALLSSSEIGQAHDRCSNASLHGPYSFIGHGVILGLKTADGVLHPYASPSILDDVALVTFDGNGSFQRTDFGVIGGLPKGGSTSFNPAQHGLYTVNDDCTGTMQIFYDAGGSVPAGVETDLNIVVAADGNLVESVVYKAVTVSGTTLDKTTCPSNCEQGVQEYFEGRKVATSGFREPR